MTSIYLENLAKIKQLDTVPASPELGLNKLESARKRLRDAGVKSISNETRFDAAYNAIRDCSEVGLLMHGYRTTSKPGHHQIAMQSLVHTLGIEERTVQVLDGLRKVRHLSDYDGDTVPDSTLADCVRLAAELVTRTEAALTSKGWL